MKVKIAASCPESSMNLGGIFLVKGNDFEDVPEIPEIVQAIDNGYLETLVEKKEVKKEIRQGEELVIFAEQRNGKIARVSLELLGKARELALKLNVKTAALLLVEKDNGVSKELIAYGADKVYVAENILLENYQTSTYSKVVSEQIEKIKPSVVLFGATHIGRDLAPRIAQRINTGLTADCTGLDITDDGLLLQTRPAFGGNLMAQIICKKQRPQMSTVRPGVMKMLSFDGNRKGEILPVAVNITEKDMAVRVLEIVKSAKKKELTKTLTF